MFSYPRPPPPSPCFVCLWANANPQQQKQQQQTVVDCGGGSSQQQNSVTSYGSIGPSSSLSLRPTTNNRRPVTPSLHVELVNDDDDEDDGDGGGDSDGGDDLVSTSAAAASASAIVIRSYDDLSTQDLVACGHFGGSSVPATAPILLLRRRPSIFRRCYSSESNVLIPVHPSSSSSNQQQQQQWNWSAAAAASIAGVASSSHPQQADSDALVNCLPPYYWQAKHMPKLVKVRINMTTTYLFFFTHFYFLPSTRASKKSSSSSPMIR